MFGYGSHTLALHSPYSCLRRNDKSKNGSSSPSLAKGWPRSGRGSGIISPCGAMDTDLEPPTKSCDFAGPGQAPE